MLPRTTLATFTRLAGCTCRPLLAPARLYSAEAQTASSSAQSQPDQPDTQNSAAYSTPSTSYKFSNPTDAYDHSAAHPSAGGLPPPAPSQAHTQPQPQPQPDLWSSQSFPADAPTSPSLLSKRSQGKVIRQQRQQLSAAEAQTFADLLSEILPASSAGKGIFDTSQQGADARAEAQTLLGLGPVRDAVGRKTGEKVGAWERRQRTELTIAEEQELDRLREQMARFETDHELLEWSVREVFGFPTAAENSTLFPDARFAPPLIAPQPGVSYSINAAGGGPNSRIYPDLILNLFLLLRDTHNAPHTALSVFALASATPHSYVSGCTTKLYNEVLRTRWAEGDVESVASAVDEMQSAGVRMDEDTNRIVAEIGEAIQADRMRAELRAGAILAKEPLLGVGRTEEDREALVQRSAFFSQAQVTAWVRCEREVETVQRQWAETSRRRAEQKKVEWEKKKAQRDELERERALRESPNRFFRQPRDESLRAALAGSGRATGERKVVRERDYYADEGEDRDDGGWGDFEPWAR